MVFAASTGKLNILLVWTIVHNTLYLGSGKTLAYTLPAIQSLMEQGVERSMYCLIITQSFHQFSEKAGYIRHEKRPRVLVLVPTRELATQVLQEVYSFPLLLIANCALFHCFERMFPISTSFITLFPHPRSSRSPTSRRCPRPRCWAERCTPLRRKR
jgi:hypothetical protein